MTPHSLILPSGDTEPQGKERGSHAVLSLLKYLPRDNHCFTPKATRAVPAGMDRSCCPLTPQKHQNKIPTGSPFRKDQRQELWASVQPKQWPSGGPQLSPALFPDEGTALTCDSRERNPAQCPSYTLRAGCAKRYGCQGLSSPASSGSEGASLVAVRSSPTRSPAVPPP